MKTILWDFDGVILDSMLVRDEGFRQIFNEYSKEQVEELIVYHRKNGGLSRYVKIRFFYESILGKEISEELILNYANEFSKIMKKMLVNKNNLIEDAVVFIKNQYKNYNFHIVSGSDEKELRYLCQELGVNNYFLSIHGSPTPKNDLVKSLIAQKKYVKSEICLIGDSINDYEAAKLNGIKFYGYNSEDFDKNTIDYIESLENFLY